MAKRKTQRSEPRGLYEGFDTNSNKAMLVRAPVGDISRVIDECFAASSRQDDVGCGPVATKGAAVFVAQPLGQDWSAVLEDPAFIGQGIVSSKGAQAISRALDANTLVVVHEDANNFYAYELFQSGQSVEYFEWGTGEDRFRSSVGRKLSEKQLHSSRFSGIKFINTTMDELEAFVPPAVIVRVAENSCTLVAGDEDSGQWDESMWVRIDCLSVAESKLPGEHQMDLSE